MSKCKHLAASFKVKLKAGVGHALAAELVKCLALRHGEAILPRPNLAPAQHTPTGEESMSQHNTAWHLECSRHRYAAAATPAALGGMATSPPLRSAAPLFIQHSPYTWEGNKLTCGRSPQSRRCACGC